MYKSMNLDRKTKKKKKKKKKKVVMDTAERIIAQRGGTEPFGYKKKTTNCHNENDQVNILHR